MRRQSAILALRRCGEVAVMKCVHLDELPEASIGGLNSA